MYINKDQRSKEKNWKVRKGKRRKGKVRTAKENKSEGKKSKGIFCGRRNVWWPWKFHLWKMSRCLRDKPVLSNAKCLVQTRKVSVDWQVRCSIILYRRSRIILGPCLSNNISYVTVLCVFCIPKKKHTSYIYIDRRLLHTLEWWLRACAGVVLVAWWLGGVFASIAVAVVLVLLVAVKRRNGLSASWWRQKLYRQILC